MRRTLRIHPSSVCAAVNHIEVNVVRPQTHRLVIDYVVNGRISDLAIPPVAAAARTDDLWRHTCFEAFVRNSRGTAYYEFNFAPSTHWAAYSFSSYRSDRRVATEVKTPRIAVDAGAECYTLQASLDLGETSLLARGGGGGVWCLGLSAVIEETSGHQSHWALAHAPGKPDFHHSDCFALEVPQAQQP
jgi:hypothetical protein